MKPAGPLPAGDPHRLGAHPVPGGVSFAVWAPEASAVELCTFDPDGRRETGRHALRRDATGLWHGLMIGAGPGLVYGYRAHGPWSPGEGLRFNPQRVLLDPYAQEIVGRYAGDLDAYLAHQPDDPLAPHAQDNASHALKARVATPHAAARRAAPPDHRQRVIAEVHVRSATARHPGIPAELRGTYAALAHPAMLAHWKSLGITTIELLPLQQRADEARLQRMGLSNHWGYSTVGYFAAEPRYASEPDGAVASQELAEAIAGLHDAGFEVLLDVVYNHTAETDEFGPTLSFRGFGNRQYYRLPADRPSGYENWAGCGNVLDLSEPMVLRFVIDSLRHWVQRYGVDGFRFDLAPALARNAHGAFDTGAALFGAIQADELLRSVLMIAEPWDLGPGGYQPGRFPPGWLEWSDVARDALRAYWLRPGDPRGTRAALAHRLTGSADRFRAEPGRPRGGHSSVNFITAHDGYTLHDLVSHDHRHNHANGEEGRDGHHDNLSWNCGVEGPTDDAGVRATRDALKRALLATLMASRGTPMLLHGDELGHSQKGNNNAYCQDNDLTRIDWAAADGDLLAAVAHLVRWRRSDTSVHDDTWLSGEKPSKGQPADSAWATPAGDPLSPHDWHDTHDRALRWHLAPRGGHETVLLFNPDDQPRRFVLPPASRGDVWQPVVDSAQADARPGGVALEGVGERRPGESTDVIVAARSVQAWQCGPRAGRRDHDGGNARTSGTGSSEETDHG